MQSAVAGSSALESLLDNRVLIQLVVLDGLVNADNILPDDTTSTNIQVTDFGVAHESLRQANSQRRGIELRETLGVIRKLVHHRRLTGGNSVAILGRVFGGNAPSINDD
jgi:hypothetical protein